MLWEPTGHCTGTERTRHPYSARNGAWESGAGLAIAGPKPPGRPTTVAGCSRDDMALCHSLRIDAPCPLSGEVAERSKAAHLRCVIRETVSEVRILPHSANSSPALSLQITMTSKAREFRAKAAQCEKRAKKTRYPRNREMANDPCARLSNASRSGNRNRCKAAARSRLNRKRASPERYECRGWFDIVRYTSPIWINSI